MNRMIKLNFILLLQKIPVPSSILELLSEVVGGLQQAYGNWKVPWGDINRYQRVNTGQSFDDSKPSLPVGWLLLFLVHCRLLKRYGIKQIKDMVLPVIVLWRQWNLEKSKSKIDHTGGQYFDPASKHFTDQAAMYIEGRFKDVLFYKEDVLKNAERSYQPGQNKSF